MGGDDTLRFMSPRTTRRRVGRAELLVTDDPAELSPPRLPDGADAGWAVSELFEAAWLISGRDPAELRSPRNAVALRGAAAITLEHG
jgi:hypothetical protein